MPYGVSLRLTAIRGFCRLNLMEKCAEKKTQPIMVSKFQLKIGELYQNIHKDPAKNIKFCL